MKISPYPVLLMMTMVLMPAICLAAPEKVVIAAQFDVWNNALQTANPEKVAALYCEHGGVLIPTLSNKIRSSRIEIADYFEHFLLLKPSGKIDQSFIRMLGPDAAIRAGIYTFHLTKDGQPESVQARFTFVYAKERGRWCIMEQHSSAMPENEPASTAAH